MKLTAETLSKFFKLIDSDKLKECCLKDLDLKFTKLKDSIESKKDKIALVYLLWQLFIERRWTPDLLSKVAVIFLLYRNRLVLPNHIKVMIKNTYLNVFMNEIECYSKEEINVMCRLILDEGELTNKIFETELSHGLNDDYSEINDSDKLSEAYVHINETVADLHILEKLASLSVLPFNDAFSFDENDKMFQNALNTLREAYFLQIGKEDGPLFRFFLPDFLPIRPDVLKVPRELGVLIPDMLEFTDFLWDSTLDDMINDVPSCRYILEQSYKRLLKPEERCVLLDWIKTILTSQNKCQLLYREPRLLKSFGLSNKSFLLLSSYNPNAAFTILRHSIYHYDTIKYIFILIDSLSVRKPYYPYDTNSLANRFITLIKTYYTAYFPKSFAQLFIVSSISLCIKSEHLHRKVGRRLCVLLLDVLNKKFQDSVKQDDIDILNSMWYYLDFFAVHIRNVEEAVVLRNISLSIRKGIESREPKQSNIPREKLSSEKQLIKEQVVSELIESSLSQKDTDTLHLQDCQTVEKKDIVDKEAQKSLNVTQSTANKEILSKEVASDEVGVQSSFTGNPQKPKSKRKSNRKRRRRRH